MLLKQVQKTIDKAQAVWCEVFHDQPMWPINGRYQCRTCLRYTAIAWEADSVKPSGLAGNTLHVVNARSASAS